MDEGKKLMDVIYERQWRPMPYPVLALQRLGRMGSFYGGFPKFRYVKAGVPADIIKTYPLASVWNHFALKAKLPRWIQLEEPKWVGRWVLSQQHLAPTIWANGTVHRFLLPALKEKGHMFILERGSMHPHDYFMLHQLARKDAGYPHSESPPFSIRDEIEKTKLVDYVIFCSDCVRDSYIKNGVPPEKLLDGTFGIDIREFSFVKRDPPHQRAIRISVVGVIGFRKGLHRLLKMGDWAQRKGIKMELHFAGPVQDPEAYEMFEKSRAMCIRHGTIKGEPLKDMLASCDLYALPSYEEGLPFSVLEAMSTGLAAIVSNDTGAREPVEHGVGGIVLHRFDDDEFDAELEPVLRDPERIVAMGRAARAAIEANYTFEHYCERIAKALNAIQKP